MQSKIKIIIAGAGGHGKTVADAIVKEARYELAGFADDTLPAGTIVFKDYTVLCRITADEMLGFADHFVCAIGNNVFRKDIFNRLSEKLSPATVIHPFSHVAYETAIGKGSMIMAGAVINTSVTVGENCIINSQSLVDHDAEIGAHAHVGQAAIVGSGNIIAALSYIRQGENIKSIFHP